MRSANTPEARMNPTSAWSRVQQRTSSGGLRTLDGLADCAVVQFYRSNAAKCGIDKLDALSILSFIEISPGLQPESSHECPPDKTGCYQPHRPSPERVSGRVTRKTNRIVMRRTECRVASATVEALVSSEVEALVFYEVVDSLALIIHAYGGLAWEGG